MHDEASIELTSRSAAQTQRFARRLAGALAGGDVVALDGPLGAGKTTFVRGLAEGVGADPIDVSSPTFVLCHEYIGDGDRRLIHIDAYRLHDPEELETIGFEEMLEDERTIVIVEWASRIAAALPTVRIAVALAHVGDDERSIHVQARSSIVDALRGPQGTCPTCNRPVPAEAEAFPFCSERCRLVDLGRWMRGSYRISRPIWEPEDDESGSLG